MPSIVATYDKLCAASGSVTNEIWVDLSSYGPDALSPITSGKQMWLGFLTCISYGKALTFELRPNLPTKSAGNTTDTALRALLQVPTDESRQEDLNFNGLIQTLAPSDPSTGVEKLWLRVRSNNNSAASWEALLFYTPI